MYVYVIINYDSGIIEAVTRTLETAEDIEATLDPFTNYGIIRRKVID